MIPTRSSQRLYHRDGFSVSTSKEHMHILHAASHEDNYEVRESKSSDDSYSGSSLPPLPLVVTFDLDDTLFPIREVVQEANAAMLLEMQHLIDESRNTNNNNGIAPCLDRFTAHMKDIRQEYRSKEHGAISYSELRRLAVAKELEHCLGLIVGDNADDRADIDVYVTALSHSVFDAWLTERHLSAERNLFPNTLSALAELSQSKQQPNVIIGAITNGRGCPLQMKQTIQPYFNFTVSGEDANVFPHRKPSEKIFQVALEKANQIIKQQQIQAQDTSNDEQDDSTSTAPASQSLSQSSHPSNMIWVHVGDDLTNDVGAAATFGAHSIWMTPKYLPQAKNEFWSTASPDEVAAREASAKQVIATGQMAAQISCLSELGVSLQH